MITNFMNLLLPTPVVTLGPEWAVELNAALELIDSHNHTSGKGVPVPIAGLNIDANLDFSNFKIFDLFSTQYSPVTVPLTGASNANSVSVSAGNLYFTNGSGTSVQITAGGSVVSIPAQVQAFDYSTTASNLTIDASDDFVFISVDTTSSRTITLPLASAVQTGRIYYIKDSSGMSNANPLTIAAAGADLIDDETSQIVQSDYAVLGLISDGAANWRTF